MKQSCVVAGSKGERYALESINQSNIRLLTRRITRLTQTQAGFTDELGVGKHE